MRHYSAVDHLLFNVDQCIRTLWGLPVASERTNPGAHVIDEPMTEAEVKLSSSLMRINHSGEVCAQALYQGQALFARSPTTREALQCAALEENDHLLWCQSRLEQLSSHRSILNPIWWAGSFMMGSFAAIMGDRWSLGFIAETEKQVCAHLEQHLNMLPTPDRTSQAIVTQMKDDEAQHATMAMDQGAINLPFPIPFMMRCSSKIMTGLTYYV